jgi:hypothetical protein
MFLAEIIYVVVFNVAVSVLSVLAIIPVIGVLFTLATVVLYIASLVLGPLFNGLVRSAFYEEIAGTNATYCAGCGFRLSDDMVFCPNCGKPTRE